MYLICHTLVTATNAWLNVYVWDDKIIILLFIMLKRCNIHSNWCNLFVSFIQNCLDQIAKSILKWKLCSLIAYFLDFCKHLQKYKCYLQYPCVFYTILFTERNAPSSCTTLTFWRRHITYLLWFHVLYLLIVFLNF